MTKGEKVFFYIAIIAITIFGIWTILSKNKNDVRIREEWKKSIGVCDTDNRINCFDYSSLKDIENEIQMLKDYLGVVEWTDEAVPEKTYLTSDKLKKEWINNECYIEKWNRPIKEIDKCEELKKLIK